ncbi:Rep family protein [Enterococcus gallinarum]|uniref:Rep family protein n=1 Tax=Enterococcus TaxID=1350 RepID=UPI0020908E35|nr:Rep family protein [Enterococcus gallinarum]MCO5477142.1 Rep family protein [Enterococcus gallinarum]
MPKKFRNFMYENQIKYMEKRNIPIEIEKLSKYVKEKLNPVEYAIILHDKDKSSVTENRLVAPHYHIALKFENPRKVNNVAKVFNDSPQNFEIWLNRPNNMYSYLIHKTNQAKGKFQYDIDDVVANFDFKERINKITKSIKRNRKEEIQHLIDSFGNGKVTLNQLMNELSPTEYARNEHQITIVKKLLATQRFEEFKSRMENEQKKIEVFYLFGDTGTGKTRFAKSRYKENRYITGSNRDLFANYDGESILILDELRPNSISYNELLKLTDPFNFENVAGSRYYDKKIVAEKIIITSPFSPNDFYRALKSDKSHPTVFNDVDKKEQFFRRINVYKFNYDYIIPMLWNNDKKVYQELLHLKIENHWSESIIFKTENDIEKATRVLFEIASPQLNDKDV